jgi:hypothetical protein
MNYAFVQFSQLSESNVAQQSMNNFEVRKLLINVKQETASMKNFEVRGKIVLTG